MATSLPEAGQPLVWRQKNSPSSHGEYRHPGVPYQWLGVVGSVLSRKLTPKLPQTVFLRPTGPILKQDGFQRRYRYWFINPLMQPYIITRGIVSGRLGDNGSVTDRTGDALGLPRPTPARNNP